MRVIVHTPSTSTRNDSTRGQSQSVVNQDSAGNMTKDLQCKVKHVKGDGQEDEIRRFKLEKNGASSFANLKMKVRFPNWILQILCDIAPVIVRIFSVIQIESSLFEWEFFLPDIPIDNDSLNLTEKSSISLMFISLKQQLKIIYCNCIILEWLIPGTNTPTGN